MTFVLPSQVNKWSSLLNSGNSIAWLRARLFVLGRGRAGKTAFIRALRNLPFEDTASTIGVETATLQATTLHGWKQTEGTDYEKVMVSSEILILKLSILCHSAWRVNLHLHTWDNIGAESTDDATSWRRNSIARGVVVV